LPGLRGKTALVTGASGYLADALVRHLGGGDCRLVLWSRRPGYRAPGGRDVSVIGGDPNERRAWDRALEGIDVVFHFASQTSVRVAADDPIAAGQRERARSAGHCI
jgi:nucleoside-diphosphate-sugar epimerase